MHRLGPFLLALLLLVLGVLVVHPSAAQPAEEGGEDEGGAEPAEAEPSNDAAGLFDQGLADMLDGKYDTGCPALAQSYELEPLPGALFTLAECEAKWGKHASALRKYRKYLNQFIGMTPEEKTDQRGRDQVASEQVELLRNKVPLLKLVPPEGMAADTIITLDGEPLGRLELGTSQEVDPGDHEVVVEVPSANARNAQTVTMAEGERKTLQLEMPTTSAPKPPPPDEGGDVDLELVAYVVGGIGAASLVVSLIVGGVTMGKKGDIEDNCVDTRCNAVGKDAADDAQTLGAVSTATFVVGLAGLAAGTVLWLLAPDDEPATDGPAPSTGEVAKLRPIVTAPPGEPIGGGLMIGLSAVW